MLNNNFEFKSD